MVWAKLKSISPFPTVSLSPLRPIAFSPLRPFSLISPSLSLPVSPSQLRAPLCIAFAGIATHKLIGFFDRLDLFAIENCFETFVDKTGHLNDPDSCGLQDRQRFGTCSASQYCPTVLQC